MSMNAADSMTAPFVGLPMSEAGIADAPSAAQGEALEGRASDAALRRFDPRRVADNAIVKRIRFKMPCLQELRM